MKKYILPLAIACLLAACVNFSQMRVCHMHKATGKVQFGIYACSPEESLFKAVFTDMKLTECAWKAHDGQQADY